MKIVEKHLTIDEDEMRMGIEIEVDGKRVFSAYDGEPEDANLSRDFSSCYSIVDLMQIAYDAGKAGEELERDFKEIDGKDGW